MSRIALACFYCLFIKLSWAQSIPPIGQWRDHLPMRNLIGLAIDNQLLIAPTEYGYFTFDPAKREFNQMTRSEGLSEVRLKLMALDPSSSKKILVYKNSNIDLVDGDKTINIPDLLLSPTQEDKTVFNILWIDNNIYLSSGLGIIVINANRNEIRDTYRLGTNGNALKVSGLAHLGDSIYAATADGLKKAFFKSDQLHDFRSWTNESVSASPEGQFTGVYVWGDRLVIKKNDSLFIRQNNVWSLLHASQFPISGISIAGNSLYVCRSAQGVGSVLQLNIDNSTPALIQTPSMAHPTACLNFDGQFWVGDSINGLLRINGNVDEREAPNAPHGIAVGDGIYFNNHILAAAGGVDDYWRPTNNPNGIYNFDGNVWTNYNAGAYSTLDSISDIISLAVDPSTESIYAASFGGGLLEIKKDGQFIVNKQQSPISPAMSDPTSYRVSGLAIDQEMNLWVSNYGAERNILAKTKEGKWNKFIIPFEHNENAVSSIVVDDLNRKWILSPRNNGVFCLDDNRTIDQPNDDRWRFFRVGSGNGNLPSSKVLSIASDRNGFVWIGTDKGIGILQCGEDIFNSAICEVTIPIVQQGNFAGPLFANESVNDIEVDGADRKWIATNNGVWLVSVDGQKTLAAFNELNSPLLSNIVHSIVVHKKTGEVFFFTESGICSYRSTATEPVTEKAKPMVFPNPIPPGFTGTIAIRDLPVNAWVRITELDGRLVHQTRSVGGQAIWNGKNYKGERVSSGVYLVYISDEFNTQRVAAKIFFIK